MRIIETCKLDFRFKALTDLNANVDWKNASSKVVKILFISAACAGKLRLVHYSSYNSICEESKKLKAEKFIPLILRSYDKSIELAKDLVIKDRLQEERKNLCDNYSEILSVKAEPAEA